MRSIRKGTEPRELAETRKTVQLEGRRIVGKDWDALAQGVKQRIRTVLQAEQAGLCAYCCGRITERAGSTSRPNKGGMIVEHWIPRSGYPDSDDKEREACGAKTFEWSNLLGVCVGISLVQGTKERHCGEVRQNYRLMLQPAQLESLERRFRIEKGSGILRPSEDGDTEVENDLQVLNLNTDRLRANRKAAIDKIRDALRRDSSERSLKRLWRLVSEPNPQGLLPPYAPAVSQYLERKLRARNIRPVARPREESH